MDKLTSFDEVRRAAASIGLLCTKAFIFLKPAITDIGTAFSGRTCYSPHLPHNVSWKILNNIFVRFGPKMQDTTYEKL